MEYSWNDSNNSPITRINLNNTTNKKKYLLLLNLAGDYQLLVVTQPAVPRTQKVLFKVGPNDCVKTELPEELIQKFYFFFRIDAVCLIEI